MTKQEETGKHWRIELHEGLLRVWPLDTLIFGRRSAHTFLRLVDDQGQARHEIHGVPAVEKNGKPSILAFNLSGLFNLVAQIFSRETRVRLLVTHSNGRFKSGAFNKSIGTTLLSGEEGKMLLLWNDALERVKELNALNLPYKIFGFSAPGTNCNTVTRDLCHVMGIEDIKPTTHTPGFQRKLKEIFEQKNWEKFRDDIARDVPEKTAHFVEKIRSKTRELEKDIRNFWNPK